MEAEVQVACPVSSSDPTLLPAGKVTGNPGPAMVAADVPELSLSLSSQGESSAGSSDSAGTPSDEPHTGEPQSNQISTVIDPAAEMVSDIMPSESAILTLSDEPEPLAKCSDGVLSASLPAGLAPAADVQDRPATVTPKPNHVSPSIPASSTARTSQAVVTSPDLDQMDVTSQVQAAGTSPGHCAVALTNGDTGHGAALPLQEVDLRDDVPGRRPHSLSPASPVDGDDACSPLSEFSDDLAAPAVATSRPAADGGARTRNARRVDVELEAQLFNLSDKVGALTEEKGIVEERLRRCQEDVTRLADENGRERSHITTLQQQLATLRAELDAHRETAVAHARRHQEASRALELELNARVSRTRAQFEAALRDKDKMVLRYAQSEKSVIDAKREAVAADKRSKEALKEKNMLLSKVNHLVQERNRMSQQMELKIQEAKVQSRDSVKMKEDIESRDVRIKWLQNKMKQESDSYKEGQLRMDTLLRELREAQETIRQYKLTEDSRSTALDRELREEKARRLVEEKLKQDSTHKERALASQLQEQQERCSQLAQEHARTLERALSAESALEPAESARARCEKEAGTLRHQVEALLHDSAELDEQRAVLERERERLSSCEAEIASLQSLQADLQADLDGCHTKEADLLDFTQKLTEKNVELQSQLSGFQARAQAADFQSREFSSRRAELESRLEAVTSRLAREQEARSTDNQLLARRLAERTHQVEDLTKRAEDAENETAIVRKKHRSSVRELQRELSQVRRRLESQEPSPAPTPADALSQASRASSSGSLAAEVEPPHVQVAAPSAASLHQQQQQPAEPDLQALIERIVRLQRQVARRNEKIDFLEDHNSGLVEEVRRKSRLLQHYVLREEAGALASQHMDQAKADLMRKGGIMATVYGSQSKDHAMTFDLSLEINKKLQTVLEDTLLKNMTLKDNMNMLGQEIAALMEENRRLARQ